ncbi:hypothetical protein OEZ86_014520 [Tetradesmus obliquus]|uniref:Uncharacterized protein n=2 Tax=Tetradesmus obliquus TaxID=3088 RepID=A0A383VTD1_TETOB|nr:hypothetical protein OEZ85_014260 [Tetradesmus obliquus]WIA37618.1 hypothetical protein OEZ86_014520 [Tetradesmus obliquus]
MASLPSAAAASGNRKMLGASKMPDINVAVANAQAQAAAASSNFNQHPTYVGNNNNYDDKCKHGGCNQHVPVVNNHPSYSACQSAASAYASGTAISSGNGGFAFSNAKAFADARSTAFGSDDWKNKFINACSSSAYAEATSLAGSGK